MERRKFKYDYDYTALKAKILGSGKTMNQFAKDLGFHPVLFSRKLHSKSEFTRSEIAAISQELKVNSAKELEALFFRRKI